MRELKRELVDVGAMGLSVAVAQSEAFKAVIPSPIIRGGALMVLGIIIVAHSRNDLVKTAGRGLAAGGMIDLLVEYLALKRGVLNDAPVH